MTNYELHERLKEETAELDQSSRAAALGKIAAKYYKEAPTSDRDLVGFCEQLMATSDMGLFSIATQWLKRRQTIIDLNYFNTVERWLYEYVDGWWRCDQFCSRVLNSFVDKYNDELFPHVLKWVESDKVYVRRAAPVSLISTGSGIRVKSDIERVLLVVDCLKHDKHLHIEKAIGWLLKYAYRPYPNEVLDYLKENVDVLSRTTFRYALEKVPKGTKQKMMRL